MIKNQYVIMVLIALVTILFIRYALIFIKFIVGVRERWKAAAKVPGGQNRGHWILGNIPDVKEKGVTKLVEEFRERAIAGTRLCVTWRTIFFPVFVVLHPDTAKEILVTTEPKAKRHGSYAFLQQWLGDGLLISEGRKWERNRRLLTPAFHFKVLVPYFHIYNESAKKFMSNIQKAHETNEYINIPTLATLFTLDVILQCAFSYSGDIQDKCSAHPYAKAVIKLAELVVMRGLSAISLLPSWVYNMTKDGREFNHLTGYVQDFAQLIIDKRRKELAEKGTENRNLDFLDILLTVKDSDGVGLSNEDIRAEVDTFLFEGHDTTASLVTLSLYCLAKYPEMQQKLRDEVLAVLEDRDYVSMDDLPKLVYTSMFMKESMRMYAPVPGISRETSKLLSLDGVTIPKGCRISIPIQHIHYNGDVWDNPREFKPERFSDDNFAGRHPYMFVPFSAGPRNCIGQNLAIHEEKVVLCHIVKNFDLTLKEDHEIVLIPTLVNRSSTGVYIKFTRR